MSLPTLGAGPSGGGGGAAPFVGFLNGVSNVEHVYLLFRGLTSYTGDLVRLRRDSDDAEADFGVDSGGEFLDTAAITAWLSGATAYVVTIYDQAAAGDDITQATEADQPALTLSDATVNNRPVVAFNGDHLRTSFAAALGQPHTIFSVAEMTGDVGAENYRLMHGFENNKILRQLTGKWGIYSGSDLTSEVNANNDWNIWIALFNGASSEFWHNGTSLASGNAGNDTDDEFILGSRLPALSWIGNTIGAIIIDGESSDADKNTVGQKFDDVYGISYTDIT